MPNLLMMNQLFRIGIINCNRWILMLKSSELELIVQDQSSSSLSHTCVVNARNGTM